MMALNVSDLPTILVYGEALTTTKEVTYLGSTVRFDRGAHNNIKKQNQ